MIGSDAQSKMAAMFFSPGGVKAFYICIIVYLYVSPARLACRASDVYVAGYWCLLAGVVGRSYTYSQATCASTACPFRNQSNQSRGMFACIDTLLCLHTYTPSPSDGSAKCLGDVTTHDAFFVFLVCSTFVVLSAMLCVQSHNRAFQAMFIAVIGPFCFFNVQKTKL